MSMSTDITASEIASLRRNITNCAEDCISSTDAIVIACDELSNAIDGVFLALEELQFAVEETNDALEGEGMEILCSRVYRDIKHVKESIEEDYYFTTWKTEEKIKALLKNNNFQNLQERLKALETVC